MDSNTAGEDVNKRVADLIKALGLNVNSFSVAIGVANPVITNIVGGRRSKPSFDLLAKILLSFDNINADWLIIGKGSMFKDAHPNAHLNAHPTGENPGFSASLEEQNELLKLENARLHAQIEALYRAFRELGASSAGQSSRSKTA